MKRSRGQWGCRAGARKGKEGAVEASQGNGRRRAARATREKGRKRAARHKGEEGQRNRRGGGGWRGDAGEGDERHARKRTRDCSGG